MDELGKGLAIVDAIGCNHYELLGLEQGNDVAAGLPVNWHEG